MPTSLYSFIRSYTPRLKKDPKEDFLTQIFAWTLANIDRLAYEFCQYIITKIDKPAFSIAENEEIGIETQYSVTSGFIDMFIRIGEGGFICEHKIWAPLGDGQILKYKDALEHAEKGEFYTVLITASKLQHIEDADIKLIWADVYDFLGGVIESYTGTEEFMITQLLQFLKEQGLGRMVPITMEGILSCHPYQAFTKNIDIVFEEIKDYPWEENCKFLKSLNPPKYNPTFFRWRWGRKGIEFFSSWQPGLFVGVLIYGEDHCLKPLDEKKGPDFVVFLEFDYSRKNKITTREEFLSKPGFQELVNNLQREHGDFDFIKEHSESPWRVLILRKPLFDIFKGTNTYREQVNKVYETACKGINLITQDNLIGIADQS